MMFGDPGTEQCPTELKGVSDLSGSEGLPLRLLGPGCWDCLKLRLACGDGFEP